MTAWSGSAAQPPAAEKPIQPPQSEADALPGLKQPGDDATPELKTPLQPSEEAKARSLAAYMEGVAAQKNGDFPQALKAFQQAAEADPTAPEPVRAQALLLVRLNRMRQAEDLARKAAELDPDDFEIRLQLADLLLARRSPDEALNLVEAALSSKRLKKDSKDYIGVHRVRGALYLMARNASKAAESYIVLLNALEQPEDFGLDFREHQRLMEDRTTGYEPIGRIMLEIGRYPDAITAFSALARVNSDKPGDYHYWLALAQYRKDDLVDAEASLNRYFESGRRSRDSLRLLNDILNAASRGSEIIDRLQTLAENSNDAGRVRLFLGDILVDNGNGKKAAEVYQSVIADSGDADAYLGLIKVDILNRDATALLESVNKAIRARIAREELGPLETLIANDPEFGKDVVATAIKSVEENKDGQDPIVTHFAAQLAEKLELSKEEETLLLATLSQNPGQLLGVEALNRLGLNQYTQDKFAEAAATFRKLLSVPTLQVGDQIMTLYRLSYAETFNDNHADALAAIEAAIKLAPSDNGELTFQLGWVQLQAGQPEESEKSLKKAITLAENDTSLDSRARLLLGGLYTQSGRWKEAIASYGAILETPELNSETARRTRMGLSNAYVQSGDMANGERILEEVYKESPDDPGVNNDLGYLYAEQNKNLDKAEQMIRLAVKAEPDNPAYLDSLGWVLHRIGRNEEALTALEKANADPDYRDATIIEHLGDVQMALGKTEEALKSWKEALAVEAESTTTDAEVVKRIEEKIAKQGAAN